MLSLGPLTLDADGNLAGPAGTRQVLDLAPLPQQTSERMAVLESAAPLANSDALTEKDLTRARDGFAKHFGYRPAGTTLNELIAQALTAGSDPTGDAGPLPLVPTREGRLEIWLGGRRVLHDRFRLAKHAHGERVRDLLKRQLAAQFEQCAKSGSEQYRCALDFSCEKYGVDDWRDLVPAELVKEIPGRLPHQTTISDAFTRADESPLEEPWDFVHGAGGAAAFDLSSNAARGGASAGFAVMRNDTDISSDDHYAQITCTLAGGTGNNLGVCARFASAASDYYIYMATTAGTRTFAKFVAAVQTALATASGQTNTDGDVRRVQCNGSTQRAYQNGVLLWTVTDTTLSGNFRGGFRGSGNPTAGSRSLLDNYSISDNLTILNVVGSSIPMTLTPDWS